MLEIMLNWGKDSAGYDFDDFGKFGRRIVGKGGALIPTTPVAGNDYVFSAFANIETDDDLRNFVGHYGYLNHPTYPQNLDDYGWAGTDVLDSQTMKLVELRRPLDGENVDDHLSNATIFRNLMAKSEIHLDEAARKLLAVHLQQQDLGELKLRLGDSGDVRIVVQSPSLMSALWVQLAVKLYSGMRFSICRLARCAKLFEIGSKNGLRSGTSFCCADHRKEFHSRSRSERTLPVRRDAN